MRILVSSQTFHPDHSGIALYATDLACYLAEQGHSVTVVTGFPFYPHWKKRIGDRGCFFRKEQQMSVRIFRGYLYVPKRVTAVRRMLHEGTFLVFAFFNFLRCGPQDCIVILSPPMLLGLLGIVFKRIWRCQFILHVQDLQTDAAESLAMIKQTWVVRILLRLETFIYHHSTWVATITVGMWRKLVAKGVPKEKLGVHYNWIDVATASKPRPSGRFRLRYPHLQQKFLVAYAGNIGIKQGVDILVRTAQMMQSEACVHFLIIGEGADKPRLMALTRETRLNNLTLLPFLNQDDYFDMLEDIDVAFVAQKANAGNVFFPSKLLGIMAMAKPVLISADLDSELASVVTQAACGLASAADDVEGLARNVRLLMANRQLVNELGRNGRRKVEEFDRSSVLSGFMFRLETEHKERMRSQR
jgi:colanic acid biosynthesis glycosyl transferase WcaI